MKVEDIKDAVYEAFKEYWQQTPEIRINGRLKKQSKFNQLCFDENDINRLQGVICCEEDLTAIHGTLEAYIQSEYPELRKSVRLYFTISSNDYSFTKNDNEKLVITIKNVSFIEQKCNH